ncbi:putative HD superfamily hydrolase involved in NAD metabolism [Natranaerovirga hydrolytica]|uniref:bis(5'-nucleosyl)-tetraphosphatase (symmetrical) n=1 Tax=Natranaerovirga hydrolytica TaxID=680378 RepID=A0A4R1N592_9FIRM|nr:bis(5'-nucleosyl)-tetraphosphatase (symmetrical) YqeK [Natranaerovirga hydrolytica]TCK98149.1 putative HD superfamily hydrolase involved in NAD metabolism [Natranaerovirga hydrolytica]
MKYDINKIRKKLKRTLHTKRYIHSIGVSTTAVCLAMKYGYDLHEAEVAGLVHDCAKNYSDSKKIALCKKNSIVMSPSEQTSPDLLHAKVGAVVAQSKYDIDNRDILNAVKYHTTGRPDMSLLEKIIYIADFIEPNRTQPNLKEYRNLAFLDLEVCLLRILRDTITYLEKNNKEIDNLTKEAYNYYNNLINNQ